MTTKEFLDKLNKETGCNISQQQLYYLERQGLFNVPRHKSNGFREYKDVYTQVKKAVVAYRDKVIDKLKERGLIII